MEAIIIKPEAFACIRDRNGTAALAFRVLRDRILLHTLKSSIVTYFHRIAVEADVEALLTREVMR
jgi:hypothetical protein